MSRASDTEHKAGCTFCQHYYSVATLAERFELSEKTIRRMITEGKLKAKKIRGSVRIPHDELAKLLQDY